ncbi:response regulator [Geobacter pelophilus]|jgi:CheY-like chemotaxis protein/Tfp pilus assembly protein PilZ|uniref:Response regulator n=1 Tax=Geoanaerobacter pelophilus TaxID=60036 RepID=A0AAW4L2Q0_9BACT|nr:response regulator [Geoanaerobacter pelophilus]MBT0665389.1 response regulator [Geoanaerobacter pelophilus]
MPIPKILLVDDVRLFLEIEKRLLEQSLIEILTATDGEDALDIVRRERPALVVMDINMPRMDGIDCCRLIKSDPDLAGTAVMIVTNASNADDVEQSWKAGCDDFIVKPIDGRLFLEKAHRFLNAINRRRKRVLFQTEVALQIEGRLITGHSFDLGYMGMYVASSWLPSVGETVVLSFRLLDTSPAMTVARGKVIWVNHGIDRLKQNYPDGFGVEFLEIIGEGLTMIRANELMQFVDLRKGKE